MPDAEEKSVDCNIKNLTIFSHKTRSGNSRLVPENFLRIAIPQYLYIMGVQNTLLHGLRRTENITAHNHIDLAAKPGKICRLLACRIAAANHGNNLLPIEESVASRARRYSESLEFLLRRQAQILRCRAGSYYQCLRDQFPAIVVDQFERSGGKIC